MKLRIDAFSELMFEPRQIVKLFRCEDDTDLYDLVISFELHSGMVGDEVVLSGLTRDDVRKLTSGLQIIVDEGYRVK